MRVKCNVASSGKLEYSNYMNVSYGTPQGSCLGPLIFLIFINDLHRHLVHSSAILFADDTTLHKTHRNLTYLKWCLEDDLSTLSDWFAVNKLTLNLGKTVCVLFQKNNNKKEIELKVKDMLIPSQLVTKFLGMWLDQTLSWHSHIQKLTLKIKRNKYLLNNGKHLMDQDTKKLVYYSHIASHIQYGLLLWGNNANKDQITRLQKLQTKCLQLVQSNQTKSNPNKNLGILTIDEMISLENMKFGYKLVHHTVNLNNLTIMDQIKTPSCRVELVRIKPISSVNYLHYRHPKTYLTWGSTSQDQKLSQRNVGEVDDRGVQVQTLTTRKLHPPVTVTKNKNQSRVGVHHLLMVLPPHEYRLKQPLLASPVYDSHQ